MAIVASQCSGSGWHEGFMPAHVHSSLLYLESLTCASGKWRGLLGPRGGSSIHYQKKINLHLRWIATADTFEGSRSMLCTVCMCACCLEARASSNTFSQSTPCHSCEAWFASVCWLTLRCSIWHGFYSSVFGILYMTSRDIRQKKS